ncbi:tyrosine-type recombinase/integrase [Halomonas desiderata]|uniref:tyrosine-type recombinase/integrase n=1 Tax=Billgrantia desiderata TaxID=52021 RepID=UPI0017481D75|nr:tyrosine-type recombinase/integrase [Halomonas desiderata]
MADHLIQKKGMYHVRLDIPEDVREAFGGRKALTKTLKTGSRREANERKLPILHAWRKQIRNARQGQPLAEAERNQWPKAQKKYSTKLPFTHKQLEKFEKYQKEIKGISTKTVDTQISKIKQMDAYFKENGDDLTFGAVHRFLETLAVATKTKKQYLYAGNSFHKWMYKYNREYRTKYKQKSPPFEGHDLPSIKKGKKKEEKRLPFQVEDLPKLHSGAVAKGKLELADMIKIASYTGCRIEEICKLKTEHIIEEKGIKCLFIEEGKTDSSIRKIPIHPKLKELIDELATKSSDGYLIKSSGGNKYGIRSDSHSKAFGRLKTEMGYDARYVFHSIRKTVITALQHIDTPPLIIASIVGHETGTVTFDIYSEGASAEQMFKAIKKLNIPPFNT